MSQPQFLLTLKIDAATLAWPSTRELVTDIPAIHIRMLCRAQATGLEYLGSQSCHHLLVVLPRSLAPDWKASLCGRRLARPCRMRRIQGGVSAT